MRVACVDNGSNAIRFVVADFTSPTDYSIVYSLREPVRMGHGVFIHGRLNASCMDRALEAYQRFKGEMDRLGVSHYRVVATSAIRESSNGQEFVDLVLKKTGIQIEVITGSEESRLALTAIKSRIPLGTRPWIIVDLGGGSVEVSLVDDSGILWSESHTMGSVRLLEDLSETSQDPGRFRRVLSEYISTLRVPSVIGQKKPAGFVATGGNIEAIAKIAGLEPNQDGVTVLSVRQLEATIDSLSRRSYRERVEELGLREDRADVILPAAMVYERLASLAGVAKLYVPNVGIKEGVLIDLVDDLSGHRKHEAELEAGIENACLRFGRRYFFDEAHGKQVTNLSRSLFDQLSEIHGLPEEKRRILTSAAMVHDVGSYISRKKHHRHTYYLVKNSEFSGLSPQDIDLVATVARFHRKSDPTPDHDAMNQLDPEDQEVVVKLAPLLRIADALDREHKQLVRSVKVNLRKDAVVFEVDADGEFLLEKAHFKKRGELFTQTFGPKVKIQLRRL
ncbi:MAG: Ppx/GppA family phosphatase [Candidatus Eisenbacteria bacterium]|uniref:Ppx/GppA family phosphatase n=1 Tax=Eiseniibacteriota bacterium TaxID=2212470 RepID=A0A7Y2H2L4_UNCEI|nr:Ppx/GppA family phosphatase [Candidatus Eisenbacteria bacterium]